MSHVLRDNPPDPITGMDAYQKFLEEDAKEGFFGLHFSDEPATVVISLQSTETRTKTKQVWEKHANAYQEENIHLNLNLRTRLYSISFINM